MTDVLIIGGGPAGVSAALYSTRAGLKTVILAKDGGSLSKAEKIENYYGFENPVSGEELLKAGVKQAERLGVTFIKEEVVDLGFDGNLRVKTNVSEYGAKCVILATGAPRSAPKIKGIADFEGKGVGYCAVCDAFFYRGKDVAVMGAGRFALNELNELIPIARSVTLVTNGAEPTEEFPPEIKIIKEPIESLSGKEKLEAVNFKDGSSINVDGIFIAYGVAGSTELARKLGAEIKGNKIAVDESMATNVPGLFAAGDCTGGMLQIAKAVYQGAAAGAAAVRSIRASEKK